MTATISLETIVIMRAMVFNLLLVARKFNTIDFDKISFWIKNAGLEGLKSVIYVGNGEPLLIEIF